MPPPPDIAALLARLGVALKESRVRFTWKAEDEVAELAEDITGALVISFHLAERDPWI